jgi:hypothetical protein
MSNLPGVVKAGFWPRLFDLFFGYDYFIAHRSVDGKPYATALYEALTQKGNELDCFLDVKHYNAGGNLPWMQDRALKKTTRLIVVVTPRAHDPAAQYLQSEIRQFKQHHPTGIIVSIGSRQSLSREFYPQSSFLSTIPNLSNEDICILEDEGALLAGNVSHATVAKLLNDFGEQRRSTRRLRWIRGVAVLMFLLALAAGGLGWRAHVAQRNAEESLTQSFLRTVGTSEWSVPSQDERTALWELSALPTSNENVRRMLIDRWTQTEELVPRALAYQGRGLHAAIGLNQRLNSVWSSRMAELCERLTKTLEQETNPDRALRLGEALAALAMRLSPDSAAPLAGHFTKKLKRETDDDNVARLSRVVVALAARLNPEDAAPLADLLTIALEEGNMYRRQRSLNEALVALAPRLSSESAAPLAGRFTEQLKRETDFVRLMDLGGPLVALSARLRSNDAAPLAARLAEELKQVSAPERETKLGEALAALAVGLTPESAGPIAEGLTETLEQETASDRVARLAKALGPLNARLSPEGAAAIADRAAATLLSALNREAAQNYSGELGEVLAALLGHLSPESAASIAERAAAILLNRLEREAEPKRLATLGESLAALLVHLSSDTAAPLAERGALTLLNTLGRETDPDRASDVARGLAAVAAHLNREKATPLAKRLTEVLEQETDPVRMVILSDILAALLEQVSPENATRLAKRGALTLLNALKPDAAPPLSGALGQALAALTVSLPGSRHTALFATSNLLLSELSAPLPNSQKALKLFGVACIKLRTEDLTEILKWPFCVGESRRIVLAELEARLKEKKASVVFGGDVWKFVEQAPALGIEDLESPPKRPKAEDARKELTR